MLLEHEQWFSIPFSMSEIITNVVITTTVPQKLILVVETPNGFIVLVI